MLYEAYLEMLEMTYPEFVNVFISGTVRRFITFTVTALLFFCIGKSSQNMLDTQNSRKLKQICRWEKRPMRYQVKHILEMFIEHYTDKNNINWDEVDH